MRPLNPNERRLAIVLGAVLLLLVNFAAMRWVADTMRTASSRIATLEAEATELNAVLAERPFWIARRDWLAAHPPAPYDERATRSQFVQAMQASLAQHKLKVDSQQPLDTERIGDLAIANIDLVVTGRLEAIVRWLHSIQQPGKSVLVRSFTLKQGEDGNSMQLQIRLGKVYRAAALATNP